MVKRLSTMRETQVRALGWEDPLEKEMATHSRMIAYGKSYGQRSPVDYSPRGRKESDTTEHLHYSFSSCWSLVSQMLKNLLAMWEIWLQSLGWKNPLENGKATHSIVEFYWRIPWTIWSMGSQRVRHD